MAQEFLFGLPLILIMILSVKIPIVDALFNNNRSLTYLTSIVGLILVMASAVYTLTLPIERISQVAQIDLVTKGSISFGAYAAYFDILFCLAGLLTIIASKTYFRRENVEHSAFYSMMIFAICGMMVIAHSSHLLTLFVGIEIMSISFYVLAGYFRDRTESVEAALKYFLLGAFSTGFLVYGMTMIYGATGSMYFNIISNSIQTGQYDIVYITIGIGLMIVGMSFKVAAFPFHQWAPDVYSGSPTVVTAFMSTAGKAAALIGFIIVAKHILPYGQDVEFSINSFDNAQMIIAIIAALTMLVGNITAVVQNNIKRMLAYSSVAHAGYLLMGIVANTETGWSGILFYATAYMFMQIGAFVILSVMERDTDRYLMLDDYKGLSKTQPMLAAMMAIFMFSLAGIPPFAGFFGKYMLFSAAIDAGFTWLTIVAVLSSVISVYFYIGLVVKMYFNENPTVNLEADGGGARITIIVSAVGVILLGLFPSLIVDLTNKFF